METAVGGEMQLQETLLTGECTAVKISAAQILREEQLGGEKHECGLHWALLNGDVYSSRACCRLNSTVGKSLLGKSLQEEASCRRTSFIISLFPIL